MKHNTKTKIPTLSRQSQKTFIIIAALAYLVELIIVGWSIYPMIRGGFPSVGALIVYPTTTLVLPLASFLLAYFICRTPDTKLWRTCQAVMIAFLAVVAEVFLSALNTAIFSQQLGYGDAPALAGTAWLQWIPFVLTLTTVAVFSIWLQRQKVSRGSDVSILFQRACIVLLPLFTLGQIIVMYFGYTSGGALGQRLDTGIIVSELFSLAVPVIIWMVLFLLTSREKTVLQRVFTSLVYVVMGVLLVTICMSGASFMYFLGAGTRGFMQSILNTVPLLLASALFIGLVTWHKLKKFL